MTAKENGPAFPVARVTINGVSEVEGFEAYGPGLTAREYAAIRLKVPDSGESWLDAMIVKSRRDDLAAKAMVVLFPHHVGAIPGLAKNAYMVANAMLEAGK